MEEVIISIFVKVVTVILGLLPSDVILIAIASLSFNDTFIKIRGYINYFLPVHWCATLFNAWLGVILLMFIIKFVIKNLDKIKGE